MQAQVRYNEWCKIACRWVPIQKDFEAWKIALDGEYWSILYLHELPIVTIGNGGTTEKGPYQKGFPLGWKEDDKYYINNHLFLTVEFYHDRMTDLHRIVGVFAKPVSVKHTYNGEWTAIKL
ncbi:hypothetical protein BSKO_02736 [Bryopsis sp. KO-2023]|nr:hypothetical protein BSKO_02736 [Bryopsis sp. KO-2023]